MGLPEHRHSIPQGLAHKASLASTLKKTAKQGSGRECVSIRGRADGTMERMMESRGVRDATGARQRKRLIGQCHGKILSIFFKESFWWGPVGMACKCQSTCRKVRGQFVGIGSVLP